MIIVSNQKRQLITHSLLNTWNYLYNTYDEYRDIAYEDFAQVLYRNDIMPTRAMLAGREFEKLVSDIVSGREIERTHVWITGASEIAAIIKPNCKLTQTKVYKDMVINGVNYMLYGIPDWLGSGIIYDVKFKEHINNYSVGDYYDCTQHRMYFAIVDDVNKFEYLISDGKKVYREMYLREDCRPIEQTIADFEKWLKLCNLWEVYIEKWQAT